MRDIALKAGALDRERTAVGPQQEPPIAELPEVAPNRLRRGSQLGRQRSDVDPPLSAGTNQDQPLALVCVDGACPFPRGRETGEASCDLSHNGHCARPNRLWRARLGI